MEDTIREVEFNGIHCKVDMNVFDDMDLLDLLDEFQNGSVTKFKKILKAILADEFERVYEQLRDENGRVTATIASEFFQSVFEQVEAKN